MLLLGDGFYASLAGVRGLRARGYEPWLGVAAHGTYAGRSRAVAGEVLLPEPGAGVEAFAGAVAAAAERVGAAVVLPGTEGSLVSLAGREFAFPIGTCPPEIVERATDKGLLGGLASAAGLETPPTAVLDGTQAPELPFPLVVKPVTSTTRGSGGPADLPRALDRRIDSADQLAALPAGRWLAQSHVDGTLIAIGGVAWEGELVCAVHQRSLRIYPPGLGNSSYAVTVAPDRELEQRVGKLVEAIGWSGVFQAQFIDAGSARYLIDFNPRLYGSLALAIAAGLNLPAIWADLLLGRSPTIGSYRVGVHFRAEHRDARTLAHSLAHGHPLAALAGVLPRPGTTHALFSWRDPAPLLGLAANAARRLLPGDSHR